MHRTITGGSSMTMHRREFLQSGAAIAAASMLPKSASAVGFDPMPGAWRSYAVVTRLALANAEGKTQAWIPIPSVNEDAWFRAHESTWTTNATSAALARDPTYGAAILHLEWPEGESAKRVEIISRVSTRDRAIDLAKPGNASALPDAERNLYTAATALIPVDGIVKDTADKITSGAKTETDKARAIYEWIVENTFRDPNTPGCGTGDIAAMLRTGNLGGKCADLNALFVGLARASALLARDIYGIRVAPSAFGYRSLGANSDVITKAQHCRAEVYLTGYGWVAMDPADVRKVVLEEPPGHLPLADAKVTAARKTLFGAWEGNWLAYNMGGDLALPGSRGPRVGFLMYPQAETSAGRFDCLNAENFKYVITAKEIAA
jgi:transglutaminase-like putative cysteine protease